MTINSTTRKTNNLVGNGNTATYPFAFKVFTDNNPLTYVLTTAKLNAVGMRWINELAEFNFTIQFTTW